MKRIEKMIEQKVTFFSEGARLRGSFYFPDGQEQDSSLPMLIVNSGYQGFNEFYPRMFAEVFTSRGFACFGFDYRGMAESEGPKGTVLLEQQVEDIRNAVTFVTTSPMVDVRRIALLGWGMGAPSVLMAAYRQEEVAAVVAMNGFYVGKRWLKSIHTDQEWNDILREVREDRLRRVTEGYSLLADTFKHYPLDPATNEYVQNELEHVPGFGHQTRLQFTESIIDMDCEAVASQLNDTPLLICHGVDNELHPFEEAESLFAASASPKRLYRIDGKHNNFMFVDDPVFLAMCDEINDFVSGIFENQVSPVKIATEESPGLMRDTGQ
jgi:hypothetical protein